MSNAERPSWKCPICGFSNPNTRDHCAKCDLYYPPPRSNINKPRRVKFKQFMPSLDYTDLQNFLDKEITEDNLIKISHDQKVRTRTDSLEIYSAEVVTVYYWGADE